MTDTDQRVFRCPGCGWQGRVTEMAWDEQGDAYTPYACPGCDAWPILPEEVDEFTDDLPQWQLPENPAIRNGE